MYLKHSSRQKFFIHQFFSTPAPQLRSLFGRRRRPLFSAPHHPIAYPSQVDFYNPTHTHTPYRHFHLPSHRHSSRVVSITQYSNKDSLNIFQISQVEFTISTIRMEMKVTERTTSSRSFAHTNKNQMNKVLQT